MLIVYALSALWSFGCVVGCLYIVVYLFRDDEPGLAFGMLFLGFPVACFMAVLPWAFIADEASPDLVTLKKGQWVCSDNRIVNGVMPVTSGKVTTVVPTTSSECVQYSRVR